MGLTCDGVLTLEGGEVAELKGLGLGESEADESTGGCLLEDGKCARW